MRFIALAFLLIGFLAAAPSTDITGTWTAETMMAHGGATQATPTTFKFKVEGDKLTGTVKGPDGEYEIKDGKIDGNTVTFNITVTPGNAKMMYDGRIDDDGIDFITKFEGGERSDHFLAERASE